MRTFTHALVDGGLELVELDWGDHERKLRVEFLEPLDAVEQTHVLLHGLSAFYERDKRVAFSEVLEYLAYQLQQAFAANIAAIDDEIDSIDAVYNDEGEE